MLGSLQGLHLTWLGSRLQEDIPAVVSTEGKIVLTDFLQGPGRYQS